MSGFTLILFYQDLHGAAFYYVTIGLSQTEFWAPAFCLLFLKGKQRKITGLPECQPAKVGMLPMIGRHANGHR